MNKLIENALALLIGVAFGAFIAVMMVVIVKAMW